MKKIIYQLFTAIIIFSICIVSPVKAYDEDFYSSNDILFYNSEDTGTNCSSLLNSDLVYSATIIEKQKMIAEFLMSTNFKYNNNKPLNSVQMAALLGNIHTESQSLDPNSGVADNASHKGLGQWTSPGRWDMIAEPKTDINNQLNFIVSELDRDDYGKNVENFWDITEFSDLEEATFLIARNYEVGIKDGGGSTSWVSSENAKKYIQGWDTRYSYAQDMYEKYGDLKGGSSSCKGMTLDQAEAYALKYENSNGLDLYAPTHCYAYDETPNITDYTSKSILANCVAVIVYFIQNNTTLDHIGLGNGGGVVNNLLASGFTDGGSTPKPYAVFSTYGNGAGPEGHTGLIMGIEGDKVYYFQEGCRAKLSIDGGGYAGIKTESLDKMSDGSYSYAYPPNGVLKDL